MPRYPAQPGLAVERGHSLRVMDQGRAPYLESVVTDDPLETLADLPDDRCTFEPEKESHSFNVERPPQIQPDMWADADEMIARALLSEESRGQRVEVDIGQANSRPPFHVPVRVQAEFPAAV